MIFEDYEEFLSVVEHYDPDDFDDVLFVIKECGEGLMLDEFLDKINERFLDEPEIMLAAMQHDSRTALAYASDRLRDDPEVVEVAVEKNRWALEYASPRLRKVGIDGIKELAEEQKQEREISNARIDIKNKRLIY